MVTTFRLITLDGLSMYMGECAGAGVLLHPITSETYLLRIDTACHLPGCRVKTLVALHLLLAQTKPGF